MPTSTTGPVTALERKAGGPRTKPGSTGNFADSQKFLDHGDGRTAWYELAPHINGNGPAEGQIVQLRLRHDRRKVKAVAADGHEYEKHVDHLVVVGITSAAPDALAAA